MDKKKDKNEDEKPKEEETKEVTLIKGAQLCSGCLSCQCQSKQVRGHDLLNVNLIFAELYHKYVQARPYLGRPPARPCTVARPPACPYLIVRPPAGHDLVARLLAR